jgi:hypothetical protein
MVYVLTSMWLHLGGSQFFAVPVFVGLPRVQPRIEHDDYRPDW